jgi:hypothetical protein
MGNNHLFRSPIPKSALQEKPTKYINKDAAFLQEFELEGNEAKVFLSLKYIQSNYQCFSDWAKVEMREFWNFNSLLHEKSWQDVYSTSRKKDKTGLAYTEIPLKKYPLSEFKRNLSPDITLFELRVSQRMRVHGFRVKSVFYLCWLDRNHDITE